MSAHGKDCEKAPHIGGGYLHGESDDDPYEIDGLWYCGRCHGWMGAPYSSQSQPTPATTQPQEGETGATALPPSNGAISAMLSAVTAAVQRRPSPFRSRLDWIEYIATLVAAQIDEGRSGAELVEAISQIVELQPLTGNMELVGEVFLDRVDGLQPRLYDAYKNLPRGAKLFARIKPGEPQ